MANLKENLKTLLASSLENITQRISKPVEKLGKEKHADDLREKGLVASYYCDEHKRGFVTQEMVEEIKEAVARARFRKVWGKDMPDGIPAD